MTTQIECAGVVLMGLALAHAGFPRYFGWRRELAAVTLLTRQMHYVHTFFIALTVLLMGLLCVFESEALTATPFGRSIAGGLCVFWSLRLLAQFFGYSGENWKGKPFETTVHVLFVMLWAWLSFVFGTAALGQRAGDAVDGTQPAALLHRGHLLFPEIRPFIAVAPRGFCAEMAVL